MFYQELVNLARIIPKSWDDIRKINIYLGNKGVNYDRYDIRASQLIADLNISPALVRKVLQYCASVGILKVAFAFKCIAGCYFFPKAGNVFFPGEIIPPTKVCMGCNKKYNIDAGDLVVVYRKLSSGERK